MRVGKSKAWVPLLAICLALFWFSSYHATAKTKEIHSSQRHKKRLHPNDPHRRRHEADDSSSDGDTGSEGEDHAKQIHHHNGGARRRMALGDDDSGSHHHAEDPHAHRHHKGSAKHPHSSHRHHDTDDSGSQASLDHDAADADTSGSADIGEAWTGGEGHHPEELDAIEAILRERVPKSEWGPSPTQALREAIASTGCDILTVPFTPAADARCLEYMSDVGNWEAIHPLPQAFDQRTIKFKVAFRASPLSAIMKVPQRQFPTEPVSEVGAFHADRVLGVNRVPPTAWAHAPVSDIMDAVHEEARKFSLVKQFENGGAHSFEEWVGHDFKRYGEERGLIAPGPSGKTIGVSVQLFVADVRRLLDSALAIPYKAHNGSWSRWLDPRHPFPEKIRPSIYHISEIVTFDYVLGNSDRSPNKNNFVVGACRNKEKCRSPKKLLKTTAPHPGPPSFVHLDNGMCFYQPQRNPVTGKQYVMCLFQKRIVARLREVHADHSFATLMRDRLPKEVHTAIGKSKLSACQKRISDLLSRVDKCLKQYSESVVLP